MVLKFKCVTKKMCVLLALTLIFSVSGFSSPTYAVTNAVSSFVPSPSTVYAKQFVAECEGQQWFIEYVEKVLNSQAKSINTIENQDDLSNIYTIGLANQDISGKIPKAIGKLTNLQYIYLSENNLTGEIPAEVYTIEKLKNLDLSQNSLSGNLSEQILNLKELEVLLLHTNKFDGVIPKSITTVETLVNVDLSNNSLTGEIPSNIADLQELKILMLANNKLNGTLPKTVSNMEKLEVFVVSNNFITGNLKEVLTEEQNLKLLDLSKNAFVGFIDDKMLEISNNGVIVDVSGNFLTGENASLMAKSSDNFIELITNGTQNALIMPKKVAGYVDKNLNISALLKTYSPETKGIKRYNLKLPLSEYSIRVEPASEASKVKFGMLENGEIYILALQEINSKKPLHIFISIAQNQGNPYSVTDFYFSASKIIIPNTNSKDSNYSDNIIDGIVKKEAAKITLKDESTPLGYVAKIKTTKYIKGYSDGTFKPEGKITREEFAQILYIIETNSTTSTDINTKNSKFQDVENSRWSKNAINFVNDNKLMIGYNNGNFNPKANLTRSEFAKVIFNYKNLKTTDKSMFSDTKYNWANNYINAVAESKFMNGYLDKTFKPNGSITRAEVVSAMNRVINTKPNKTQIDAMQTFVFNDLTKEHWAFYEILTAYKGGK